MFFDAGDEPWETESPHPLAHFCFSQKESTQRLRLLNKRDLLVVKKIREKRKTASQVPRATISKCLQVAFSFAVYYRRFE